MSERELTVHNCKKMLNGNGGPLSLAALRGRIGRIVAKADSDDTAKVPDMPKFTFLFSLGPLIMFESHKPALSDSISVILRLEGRIFKILVNLIIQ
jgi:hypothetical protein